MFPTKHPHRLNFAYANSFDSEEKCFLAGKRRFGALIESYQGGIYHVQVRHEDWGPNASLLDLLPPPPCACAPVDAGPNFELEFRSSEGVPFLRSSRQESFGVSGSAWLFQFEAHESTRFYGLGEKNFNRLELSGIRTKFWNTDVWGDFPDRQWRDQPTDPPYLSVPYLILNTGSAFVGILLHTSATAFMETPPATEPRSGNVRLHLPRTVVVGAELGEPNLWIIYGPTLRELTRKLQKLVGVTPLPPLWALGYHQSRWGYAGHEDIVDLDRQFEKHEIPCDGLWLDIDYMDGFRVFTFDEALFPKGMGATVKTISRNRRKAVPILDPGVKREPGYSVYDDLKSKGLHCKNPEGQEFVGIVWPGETIFPDFTLNEARTWWQGRVAEFAKTGVGGVWIDMNDPSTGHVDPTSMLFQRGCAPHALHRNQYALGMQMATRAGFLEASPNERPFVLSRSGSIGTSRFSAIWTGDNVSNRFYLRMAIPTSVNLSLSGIPFNGADVGGFGGTSDEKLMIDWVKASFLFPFMRNHNAKEGAPQEPWAYSPAGMRTIRKFIRLRYKLLPYLYNLFCDQEQDGDPILRPLFYEFGPEDRLADVADQFMIGPSLLQAPLLRAGVRRRRVLLPGTEPWFSAADGNWVTAKSIVVEPESGDTPLYVRHGAIVPLHPGTPTDNLIDLRRVEALICAKPGTTGQSETRYRADDGHTLDYSRGKRSEAKITAAWHLYHLDLEAEQLLTGYGAISISFLVPEGFSRVTISGQEARLANETLELAGTPIALLRVSLR